MAFVVALLQIEGFGLDQVRNIKKGVEKCREAKSRGADLAVFPELWNIGGAQCPLDPAGQQAWLNCAINRKGTFFKSFGALAKELNLNIAISYLEAHQPKPRNSTSILNEDGDVVLNYSKVFICDFGKELGNLRPNPQEIGCDVHCCPGESFDVCLLKSAEDEVCVGAMICSDREFPEAATQLMLKGAELVVVPNACSWDEIRSSGLKTRAFDNMVGIAMANYPRPGAGNSQAFTCVAWRDGKPLETMLGKAGVQEEILLVSFDLQEIRRFRAEEAWRLEHRRNFSQRADVSLK